MIDHVWQSREREPQYYANSVQEGQIHKQVYTNVCRKKKWNGNHNQIDIEKDMQVQEQTEKEM